MRRKNWDCVETTAGTVWIGQRIADPVLRGLLAAHGERAIVAGMEQPVLVIPDGRRAIVVPFRP